MERHSRCQSTQTDRSTEKSHDRVTSYQTDPHLPGDGVTLGPVVTETVLGTILAVLPLRTPHLTLLAPPARPTQTLRQSAE